MIPASPKTYVVSRQPSASEGYTREPVIGYHYEPGGKEAPMVITLEGQRRLLGEDAVLFPCGTCVDPMHGITFGSVEEWLEFNPKNAGPRAANTDKPKPVVKDESDEVNEGGYDIEWVASTFKNQSFWHYDDGEFEFCFALPGGSEKAPKPSKKVQKIKRDDMDRLKKNIDVLDIDDVMNPKTLPNADPDEEEPGDYDEDEDDGGLI